MGNYKINLALKIFKNYSNKVNLIFKVNFSRHSNIINSKIISNNKTKIN